MPGPFGAQTASSTSTATTASSTTCSTGLPYRRSSTAISAARSTSTISPSSTLSRVHTPRSTACVSARYSTWPREPAPAPRVSTAMRLPARIPTPNRSSVITRRSASGGGFDVAFNGYQTTRGLDPPNFNSPHNNASSVGQFATRHAARGREQLHERHVRQQLQHVSDSQRRRQRRAGHDRRQRNAGATRF